MVKFDRSFFLLIWHYRFLRIIYRWLHFQDLTDSAGCHVCPWEHNGDCCDHQEGHNNLHCVLDKCHHISYLHSSIVNAMCTEIDNRYRYTVHDQHHDRHHKCHTAVYKQVCLCQIHICFFKTLFLMLLTAECADNRDSGKDFPGYQVQTVNESLQPGEFRHCNLEQYKNNNQNDGYCGSKDPGHGGIGLENLEHASDAKDGRIQNDSEHHGHNLLHLLHIVGTSRDQGCSGKFMIFVAGEMNDLAVYIISQIMSKGCCHSC